MRMGADILFCLPELRTIRLLGPRPSDSSSARRSATGSGATSTDGSGSHRNVHIQFPTHSPVSQLPMCYDMSGEGGPWATQGPTVLQFSQQDTMEAWKLMTVIPVIKCQTGFLYTEENSQIAWCMTITGDIVWQIRHGVLLPCQRQRQQERHLGLPQVLYYSGCPQLSTINPDHCLRKGPVHSIRVPSQ